MRFDRLLAAAQAVEESQNPQLFTMSTFFHDCGTPACVLGHYAARRDLQSTFKPRQTDGFTDWFAEGLAFSEDHFGLTFSQWEELFGVGGCGRAITTMYAGRYIRDFVARHGGPIT